MIKAPRSKIQDPKKIQIPITKGDRWVSGAPIGAWRLDLLWILDLGSWSFLRLCCLLLLLTATPAFSQDRLKTMPGYHRYARVSREASNAVKLGSLSVTWKDGGNAF